MNMIKKILALLTPYERRRGLIVLLMMVGLAILETSGVASIMPFLAVLANPEVVQENALLKTLYTTLEFESVDDFLFWLGVGAFSLVTLGAIFRTLTLYAMYRYTEMRRHSISYRLLETYLRQPYEFFLNRHSGDLAKSILSEVDQLVSHVFRPLLTMIAYGTVATAMIALLIAMDPMLALIVGSTIGGVYALIFTSIKGMLERTGKDRVAANRDRYETAGEALGGIKNIKVLGREHAYLSRFRSPSKRFASHQASKATLTVVPKYFIEAIGFGGILGLALYLMATSSGLGETLPLLGLYAFAGYRLLPSAQQIYSGVTSLRFGIPAVDVVYGDLKERDRLAEDHIEESDQLIPRQNIQLDGLSFIYPGTEKAALSNIDMKIPVNTSVGLVGTTGAGKTTAIDVILGLLPASTGRLLVDETEVDAANVRKWQRAIGYVPQEIFLSDTTVAENIAFGIRRDDINLEKVREVAQMAQVHDFIESELPESYQTEVGENGVRISGGQRQRIGIARALYHDPPVLVFDEATSSLDTATEANLMEAVNSLQGEKTIIMVAHRLSTVSDCDRIYLLKDGEIHASGTYDELLETEQDFRRLAGVA